MLRNQRQSVITLTSCLQISVSFKFISYARYIFSLISVCAPPSPLSCTFPTRARCTYDANEKKDLWLCENIFTGSLKRPSAKKPWDELQKKTKLSNIFRGLARKKKSIPVPQIKKTVSQPKTHPEKRLKAILDANDSKYRSNAFDDISSNTLSNRAPGTGVYYGIESYPSNYPNNNYNNIQSPYNSYVSQGLALYPSGLTYYVG